MTRSLDRLIDDINKQYTNESGKPAVRRGTEVPKVETTPVGSPALGYVLGIGGWPRGKLIEILGKEHSGKTTLALLGLKEVWEHEDRKRAIAIIDLERRYNREWAEQLGVPADEIMRVSPEDAEDATDIMKKLIKSQEVCGIIYDSIGGSMGRAGHQEFRERGALVGGTAQVMSRNVLMMAPIADDFDCTVFYLNQLRDDMSGYHQIVTPGGHAVKHMASIRLYLRPGKDKYHDKMPDGTVVQVGYRMYFKTLKNSFAPPQREASSDFYFMPSRFLDHVGFDMEADACALGMALGMIKRSGSYYSWEDIREQGRDNFFAKVREQNKMADLMTQIQEIVARGIGPSAIEPDGGPEPDGPDIDDPEV